MAKQKSKRAGASGGQTVDDAARLARLAEVARLAQIFIDGELLGQLLTPQGFAGASGDDVDYQHQPFITLKKLLLRLEQTPPDGSPVYVNVWRQRPDDATRGEPLVAGMKVSLFGFDVVPMPRAMRAAMLNQRTSTEQHPGGAVSIFAPLYDSLHRVAGAVEVFDTP